jgi:hypothetical protein
LHAVKVLWLEYSAMSTRQNGRNSQLLGRRARSARARGLRTLQHQALSRSTLTAIEAEIWLRSLIVERARSDSAEKLLANPAWATKDQVHDEALAWYLQRPGGASGASRAAPLPVAGESGAAGPGAARRAGTRTSSARQVTHEDVTFWVDSRLLARARRLAAREGLRLAQLIERALDGYIAAHIPAEVVRFHRRAQAQAVRLHRRRENLLVQRNPPVGGD